MTTGQPTPISDDVLRRLAQLRPRLSPQLRKAAGYIIDHPNETALLPMRQLAADAQVKPSTLVRVAGALGFPSFSDLRRPFRDGLRAGGVADRARRLEGGGGNAERLHAGLARSMGDNVEALFSATGPAIFREAADLIVAARRVVICAVGSCNGLAQGFHYVARMALPKLVLSPQQGGMPVDDLVDLGTRDVVLVLTFRPYRQEIIDAARLAKTRGAKLIAITDSRAAPVAGDADILLAIRTETPQFFPSMVAAQALLETLLAFIVARVGEAAVRNIEAFDRLRHDFSIWWSED
jgi:DNA-binding MurR/RpiR family transcriptional regulator